MIKDIERLFAQPAFTQLDPRQVALFRQFAKDIDGKGGPEILKLYRQLNNDVARIKPLTEAQRTAITAALRDFVPEADRKRLDGILKMLR